MSNFVKQRRGLKSISSVSAARRRARPNPLWLEALEDRIVLSTITWNSTLSPNGGSWDVAGNWTGGVVPGPNDNAVINLTSGTVSVDGGLNDSVNTVSTNSGAALTLSNGALSIASASTLSGPLNLIPGGTLSGAGTVTVNGPLVWTGGTMTGPGITQTNGPLTMGTTAVNGYFQGYLGGGRALNNYGAATLASGVNYGNAYGLYVSGGSTITNEAGATFNFTGNATINDAAGTPDGGTFINQGTLGTTGGAGVSFINIPISNSGTINTQVGTLALNDGGSFTGTASVLNQSSGAILDFANGVFNAATGTSFSGTGAGVVQIDNATVNVAGSATLLNLTQNSGTLGGTGTVTITGALNWVGGTMTGSGTTEVQGTDTIGTTAVGAYPVVYLEGGRQFNNDAAGTLNNPTGNNASNGIYVSDGATFTIKAGGSFYFTAPGSINDDGGTPDGGTLVNLGTLGTNGASDGSYITIPVINSGTINIQAGTLSLSGGGTFTGTASSLVVSSGADLDLADGTFTAATGTQITGTGAGVVELSGATLNLAGTAKLVNFLESGGTVAGTGNLTTSGLLTWTAGTMSGTGTTEAKAGLNIGYYGFLVGGRSLINDAAATVDPASSGYTSGYGIWVQDGSTITNKAGATFTFLSDSSINDNGGTPDGGTFINLGTIKANGDATGTNINIAVANSGTISVLTGNLQLNGGGTFTGIASKLTTAANTILNLANGNFTSASGSVITGTSAGNGAVQLSGGTATLNGAANLANFTETGGTLGGTGSVIVNGVLTWNAGIMSGTGTTEAKTALNIGYSDFLVGGRSLFNDVSATVNPAALGYNSGYGLWVQDGSTITNRGGATFTFASDASITDNGGSPDGGKFINQGTLVNNGGTTTTAIGIPFTNSGTISVQTGTLKLNAGLTNFNAATSTLTSGIYIVKTTLEFANANIVTNNASITLNTVGSLIGDTSGNNALTNLTTNGSPASLTLQGAQNLTVGTFVNSGLVTIGSGSTFKAANSYTQSAGRTIFTGGTLASGVIKINAGAVDGAGTLSGSVTNAAVFRPGGLSAAGLLSVTGSYTQTATGSLQIELGGATVGTQYDRLAVSGNASLSGTLGVSLINGYTPAAGSTFRPLTFATLSGDFSTKNGLDLGDRILPTVYDASGLTLVTNFKPVTTAPTPTIAANGLATVTLTASDAESPASSLVFTITSLPAGTLFRADGSVVTVGSTFTGSPVTLTYQTPTVIYNNFTDSFQYKVTDNGVPAGTPSTAATSSPATVNLKLAAPSSGVVTVIGTAGNDTIVVGSSSGNLQVTLNGVVTTTAIPVSSITFLNVNGEGGNDSITLNGLALNTSVVASAGSLAVNGTAGANTFTINASTLGFNGATITSNIPLTVNGGGGPNVFNIAAPNAAANLFGGGGVNSFVFTAAASLNGAITGGTGANTIDETAVTTPITLNLATSSLTGIANGYTNIQTVLAGTNAGNSLIGPATGTIFNITGTNAGNAAGIAFGGFNSLTGGAGNDTFRIANGVTFAGSINGGGGSDTIDDSAYTTAVALGIPAGTITGISGSVANIASFLAGTNAGNTVSGPATGSTYNITGANAGNVGGIAFSGFGNIVAGAGNNDFVFSNAATLSGSLNAGAGANIIDESAYATPVTLSVGASTLTGVGTTFSGVQTFIGSATAGGTLTGPAASTYNITGLNAGNVAGLTFSNYSNLVGGAGANVFAFAAAGSLAGGITGGGGTNSIDETAFTTPVSLNLAAGTVTGIGAAFSNIQTILAGAATNSLTGPSAGSTYSITGANAGNVGGIAFSGFGNITGGLGNDAFVLSPGGSLSGVLNGGGGADTLDESGITTAIALNIAASTVSGLGSSFSNIETILAGTNAGNALTGPATGSTYNITGPNAGNVGGVAFSGFGNIRGGAGNDTFVLGSSASLSGVLNGGGGADTLDESAFTTAIALNVATSRVTGLSNPFANIQTVIGGGNAGNTITGPTLGSIYNITGANAGNVGGIAFSGFGNVVAGAGNNRFVFSNAAALSGSLNAGAGANIIDESAYATPVTLNVGASTLTGVGTTFSGAKTFIGSATAGGTLTGPAASTYNITGLNAGNVAGLTFSNYSNLVGGAGANVFKFAAAGSLAGGITGGSGTNKIDESAYTTPVSLNLSTNTLTGLGGSYSNIVAITAGSGANTVTGPAAGSTFNITAANAGSIAGFTFVKFGNLVGGPGNDTFKFSTTGSLSGGINGGGGSDAINVAAITTPETLNLAASTINLVGGTFSNIATILGGTSTANQVVGPNSATTFNITGANAGNAAGVAFSGFRNIVGGAGNDVFKISSGVTLAGTLNGGGGTNTVDESAFTTGITVNLATSSVPGVAGGFSLIQTFLGGSNTGNTILGPNTGSVYNITGANSGNVAGIGFSGFGNLTGGTGNNTYVFSNGAAISGRLNGGTGTNTVNLSAYTTPTSVNLATMRVTGVAGPYSSIQSFIGGSNGLNKVLGPNTASVFNITSANAGNVAGTSFSGFGSLAGGTGNDSFVFSAGAAITGGVNGGAGTNTVDLSAYTTATSINLATLRFTGAAGPFALIQSFIGGANSANLVTGPATATTYNITALNAFNVNGVSFTGYRNITGGTAENAFILGNGAGLSGSLNGGVGGRNWLDYSAYTTGITVNLTSGAATGFGGTISNIYNVRGGASGADILTGNSKGNILIGGGGTNTITGGSSASLLIAGTGLATINGGSGADLIIGGSTTYGGNYSAFDAILAEWRSADTYANRINFIKNGGGLNGTNTLNLGTTVVDNLAANILTGAAGGKNWYFKGAATTITNRQPGEQVN